jgi:hypothetical protein
MLAHFKRELFQGEAIGASLHPRKPLGTEEFFWAFTEESMSEFSNGGRGRVWVIRESPHFSQATIFAN